MGRAGDLPHPTPPSFALPSQRSGVHSAAEQGASVVESATSRCSTHDTETLSTTRRNTQHFAIACDTTSTLPIVYNLREHS
ncbi:hypothetical protein PsYK624_120140 [Phanerochaete sordida]|uniref:Uncharacterized protein n=1 Tax=Phanerochaete sordida TaxID=48140 RepID=A0A9P3GLU5_9APHY|nr:hypothetical protein PsYK624_120140 [Phanerochaete sordida]